MSIEEHIDYTNKLSIKKTFDRSKLRKQNFETSNMMGDAFNERFGLFSYTPDVDKPIKPTRRKNRWYSHHGYPREVIAPRSMWGGVGKTGKLKGSYFDKHQISFASNEPYMDPKNHFKKRKVKGRSQFYHDNEHFRPSGKSQYFEGGRTMDGKKNYQFWNFLHPSEDQKRLADGQEITRDEMSHEEKIYILSRPKKAKQLLLDSNSKEIYPNFLLQSLLKERVMLRPKSFLINPAKKGTYGSHGGIHTFEKHPPNWMKCRYISKQERKNRESRIKQLKLNEVHETPFCATIFPGHFQTDESIYELIIPKKVEKIGILEEEEVYDPKKKQKQMHDNAPLKLGYKGSTDWQHDKLMHDRMTRITFMDNPMPQKKKRIRHFKEDQARFQPAYKPMKSKPQPSIIKNRRNLKRYIAKRSFARGNRSF